MKIFNRKTILFPAVTAILILLSSCAGTSPIVEYEDSIASLESVKIGGEKQWILMRGNNTEKPVMLWLAGGPCGSEMGWTREYLGELEQDVVFVNWEQAGAGKSYSAADFDTIKVQDYVDHTIELTEYLCERFGREKIILTGHSWGTIIGLMAAEQRPDLYHCYISLAQHVNAVENDIIGYNMVLNGAEASGNTKEADKLRKMGPPPYTGEQSKNYTYLLSRLPRYTPCPPGLSEPDFFSMIMPEEYTMKDTINAVRGLIKGVNKIYPQLVEIDFEESLLRLEIPAYFMTGRYDQTCVQEITERYYQKLEAPQKEFYWFENSAHNLCYQETEKFINILRNDILPQITD